MSKRSGFAVKITAFIEADAKKPDSMRDALDLLDMKLGDMQASGIIIVKQSSRFMLSALVIPDEPKAAEAVTQGAGGSGHQPQEITIHMPPVPAAHRRT